MLSQFAITPGCFDPALASSPNALDLGIGCLNDLCRGEGLFLDLHAGAWGAALENVNTKGKVFLKFARNRHRIIRTPPQLPTEPDSDETWLWEAQAYHQKKNSCCRSIITSNTLAAEYADDQAVTALEKLNQSDWWAKRSPSKTIKRRTEDYKAALALVLRHASLLMFIDSFVDPLAENFNEFPQLLLAAGSSEHKPMIQIHRPSWRREGGRNVVQPFASWISDFEAWSQLLKGAGLTAEVFIWADTHDRYLVSDIISLSAPYGFDIGEEHDPPTTWTRIGIEEVERLQFEYDPNCKLHGPIGSFEIGKSEN